MVKKMMKKFYKDKKLRGYISEYNSLRGLFNNNKDYEKFELIAEDLLAKFSSLYNKYSKSLDFIIRGYVFNIEDLIIRNKRILKEENIKKSNDLF